MNRMDKGNAQAGQGLMEYLLLVGVVILAVVGFMSAYTSGTQQTGNAVTNGISNATN